MANEQDLTPYQQIMLAKGEALDGYASLESSLALLFSILLSVSQESAYSIFYRIAAAKSRRAILEDLFSQSSFTRYKPGFDSIMKAVGQLDNERNQVAHWHTTIGTPIGANPEKIKGIAIRNPTRPISSDPGTSALTSVDLARFRDECRYWSAILSMFIAVVSPAFPRELRPPDADTWPDKFLRPIDNPYRPAPAKKSRRKNTRRKVPPRSLGR